MLKKILRGRPPVRGVVAFARGPETGGLLVFAAASLTESMQELGKQFEKQAGTKVEFSFGGSNDLARQIQAGAPADVFFSADAARMDQVEKAGLVKAADRVDLLSNVLVVVVPSSSTASVKTPQDLVALPKIALADPAAVPAGVYAKQWLEGLGLWAQIQPKVVPTLDVRAALAAVESEGAPAGIVYRTDAAIAKKAEDRVRGRRTGPGSSTWSPRSPARRTAPPPRRSCGSSRAAPARPSSRSEDSSSSRANRVETSDGSILLLTLRVAAVSTLVILPVAVGVAWLLARRAGPGRTLAETILSLPLVLPPTAVGLLLLEALRRSGPLGRLLDRAGIEIVFTWKAVVLATAVMSFPLLVRPVRAAFEEVDPRLLAMARSLGNTPAAGLPEGGPAALLARHPRRHAARVLAGARRVRRHDPDRRQHPGPHPDARARDLPAHADRPGRLRAPPRGRDRRPGLRHGLDDRGHHAAEGPGGRRVIDLDLTLPLARFTLRVSRRLSGRAVAILGASGSGKTSLLESIAGLRTAATGRIAIDGETLLDTRAAVSLPPERRRIGYVPQDALLFPHLTVERNVRFGSPSGEGADANDRLFREAVSILEIDRLLARFPSTLSGGERQRVALARAIAARPRLLLLDEPLAAVDVALKGRILPYLLRVRDTLHIPFLYVTHNAGEARAVAEEAVVLREGAVVFAGKPEQALEWVSQGDPEARFDNILAGSLEADGSRGTGVLRVGEARLVVPTEDSDGASSSSFSAVFAVSPEDVLVSSRPLVGISARNVLPGAVVALEIGEASGWARIRAQGIEWHALLTREAARELELAPGRPAWIAVKTHVFRRLR